MKHLARLAFVVAIVLSLGCMITNYPVITDTRGDFSGVIRTGHKAYIVPSNTVATIWDDGSDELFTLVYQNSYGDQMLYQFNNFDPSAAVIFLDNTYCDWRYEGCESARAWNPHQDNVDNIFDHEDIFECSGARSHSDLVSYSSRIGECGDAGFRAQEQELAATFADLIEVSFLGKPAYAGTLTAENTSITLRTQDGASAEIPIFGSHPFLVTNKLQTVFPVGPNVRHSLQWLIDRVDQNGSVATATIRHQAIEASFQVKFLDDGLRYNLARF
jgi:hypothetical protein